MWSDDDFLYFDPAQDDWFYRVTRADLATNRMDLETFLRPIYDALSRTSEYQHFLTGRRRAVEASKTLTEELAGRLRHPKTLSDLVPF